MGRFRRTARRPVLLVALSCVLALLAVGCTDGTTSSDSEGTTEPARQSRAGEQTDNGLPEVVPKPSQLRSEGEDVQVEGKVELVVDPMVDPQTRDLAVRVLTEAGATDVVVRQPGDPVDGSTLKVRLGSRWAPMIRKELQHSGLDFPDRNDEDEDEKLAGESYAITVHSGQDPAVVLGGVDAAGAYYAVQTLRQITSGGHIAGVSILDEPDVPTRGTIEGFYGSPWTHAERMDQLAFYGSMKLNTYVYAPKDDPYHRAKWREPYPTDRFERLRELVEQAAAHHVKFVFAVSPGQSICFSDEQDRQALIAKLQAMYDIGVRSFAVPFDDISYTEWNCSADRDRYGEPSPAAAGRAQAELLNGLESEFVETHPGTQPLQTVPTEYSDAERTPYKTALREELSSSVEVMWTGDGVIPEGVSVSDAAAATEVWGREPLLWDNYPVNDFDATEGRIMLGPYAKREKGLTKQLDGLIINPMNQAAASKVVEISAAAFAWNSAGFDAERAWRQAAEYLAGDRFTDEVSGFEADGATVDSLMVFFDLNRMAPLPSGEPWLSAAPALRDRLEEFRKAWNSDGADGQQAVADLRGYARSIADAPERIEENAPQDFVSDVRPWLRATDAWGEALLTTLDGFSARADGDSRTAADRFDQAAELADRAESIRTVPGETRPQGRVRVAEGVLDEFIRQAPDMR
ncbi:MULTISPECIES: beta-N-acetylglucosaminidase domain-containing protein [unclassified Actinopolyspora]|uniref:beta-N-acetylglucosaminidase domain-containing protein n=1 Tax=unclassified Actinopolyspora TaxID=2639451 RepID=UPI0013F69B24|nr:beta-N-acetylglucosaminidase [Actinopolyspora sp. BKK2]NHE77046.1 beta-N-acetylglucosaminidase [Actinopolyspora sp. BKK1]